MITSPTTLMRQCPSIAGAAYDEEGHLVLSEWERDMTNMQYNVCK